MPWYSSAGRWVARQLGKAAIWVVFVVGFALLPLILVYNDKRVGGQSVALDELFAKGELLLVVTAVGADAMGRLFGSFFASKRTKGIDLWEVLLFLASLVFVIFAAAEYSSLITRLGLRGSVDVVYLVKQSRIFLISTLLIGVGVILTVDD
jgi:uncharacterized integral membrane protein